jgi:hypothetical protein
VQPSEVRSTALPNYVIMHFSIQHGHGTSTSNQQSESKRSSDTMTTAWRVISLSGSMVFVSVRKTDANDARNQAQVSSRR